MSETKATKIIKLLLNNDLAPSLFLAISNNDEHAFQSALAKANLTIEDLTLSQDEFDNFVKGVKPSGELDLLTWEGYYVVTSQSESDPLALLILAGTEKVYWGAQSQVLADPASHAVDYKITPDNKIEFSTQADGPVSISLTREFDDDKGTATVKFSGTLSGKEISGEKAPPPIDRLKLQGRFGRKASTPLRPHANMPMMMMTTTAAAWYDNPIVLWTTTIFSLLGGLVAALQIILWVVAIHQWLREKRSKQMKGELERQGPSTRELAEESYEEPRVDYEAARRSVDRAITSAVNQQLFDHPPDFENLSVDQITKAHEAVASQAAKTALHQYIAERIMPNLRGFMHKFSAIPDFEGMLDTFGRRVVADLVTGKIAQLDSFKSAVYPVVLKQCNEFFAGNYTKAEGHLRAAAEELAESKRAREEKQQQLNELDAKIEKYEKEGEADKAAAESQRRQELATEVDKAVEHEREIEKKHEEASKLEAEAKRRKEVAEDEEKRDNSKAEWERKTKEVFAE